MAMATGGGGSMQSNINITPLIDVLLVLLVIFMITVSAFRKVLDIQVPIEQKEPQQTKQQDQIILQINADGSMAINTQPVDSVGLGQRLYEIYNIRPDKLLFIKIDDSQKYQKVIWAIDVARGAGVQVFGLAPSAAAAAASAGGS
jgi:biopolymer transport protein TolR